MYLMYVDESGDTGFPAEGQTFPENGGPTRLFVRAGVVVHGWEWWAVNETIAKFKQSRGLPWNAELRAHDLRAGKGAFKDWKRADRRVALNDLLDTIGKELDISILAVVIDKTRVDPLQRERYSNPLVRSFEFLLERYSGFLGEQKDRCGVTILDSIEQKNDANLRYFQSFLRERSEHLDARRVVEGTLFMPSHTTNLLQVADVCANVLYRYYAGEFQESAEYARIESRLGRIKVWPQKNAAKAR